MLFVARQKAKRLQPEVYEAMLNAVASAMRQLVDRYGTQKKTEIALGYPQSSISKVLEKLQVPEIDTLVLMAQQLSMSMDSLLGFDKTEERMRRIASEEFDRRAATSPTLAPPAKTRETNETAHRFAQVRDSAADEEAPASAPAPKKRRPKKAPRDHHNG